MRRFLALWCLAWVLAGPSSWAGQCACSSSSACATSPCDFNTAANWSCSGTGCAANAVPNDNDGSGNTYNASISGGHTMVLSTDGLKVGHGGASANAAISVAGKLIFADVSAGTLDGLGFRNLEILCSGTDHSAGATSGGIIVQSSGEIVVPAATRLAFNTSSGGGTGGCQNAVSAGGKMTISGSAVDATVTAISTGATTSVNLPNALGVPVVSTNCGSTAPMLYVLTLASGADNAKRGGWVAFIDGQLTVRPFEIVGQPGDTVNGITGALAANQIAFCTDLADSSSDVTCNSGDTKTCGERFTFHSTVGEFPAGDSTTPTAAPTNSRHWTPDPTGNAICAADNQPRPFCTGGGAGHGTAYQIFPSVLDRVRVVNPVWLYQSAGSQGWFLTDGGATMGVFRGVNASGMGDAAHLRGAGIEFDAVAGTDVAQDLEDLNLHDPTGGGSTISAVGYHDYAIRRLYCHDAANNNNAAGCLSPSNNGASMLASNVTIQDSVFRAAHGNSINYNSAICTLSSQHVMALHNLVEYGCTTGDSDECRGIEINCCQGCGIEGNLVHDLATVGASSSTKNGDCVRMGADTGAAANVNAGSWIKDNDLFNCADRGVLLNATNGNAGSQVAVVHNYVSNTGSQSVFGADLMLSNFLRNSGMSQDFNKATYAFWDVRTAKGNIVVGEDAAVAAGAGCSTGCSGGFNLGLDSPYFTANPSVSYSDDVFGWFDKAGGGGNRDCGQVLGNLNSNLTLAHIDCDGNGLANHQGFRLTGWTPTSATTANFNDSLFTHLDGAAFMWCSASGNLTDNVGFFSRNDSPVATVSTGDFVGGTGASGCSSEGTRQPASGSFRFKNRTGYDWNLQPGAPALTQASDGSALGIRYFRFNRERISAPWGGVLDFTHSAGDPTGATVTPFPANISNGVSNADTDEDGVPDIIDNCPLVANPNQYDGDADGKGCMCDSTGDAAIVNGVCP